MNTQSAAPAAAETQPSSASTASQLRPFEAPAGVWSDLLDVWTGQAMLEANRTAANAIYQAVQRQQQVVCSTIGRQQDLLFATARAALAAFEGAVAWADGAPRCALTAYGRAVDATHGLGATALGVQRTTPAGVAPQIGAAARQ